MLPFPFRHFFKYHAEFMICRPCQVFRHTSPGSVIAPFQQFFRFFFPRLPELQLFCILSGKNADPRQSRRIGLFSPVQSCNLLPLLPCHPGRHTPVYGRQFHGFPLQLPQIVFPGFLPAGFHPLPYLLFCYPILMIQINRLLLFQYSWQAGFFANIFSNTPFLFRSYVL